MKPKECKGCVYYDRPGPVWPKNKIKNIMIIGEAPGSNEIIEGEPFVGSAGNELWAIAEAAGLKKKDCVVTNLVKCQPIKSDRGKYKVEPAAIRHCKYFLDMEIIECQPNIVVPVGEMVTKNLLGKEPIRRFRGALIQSSVKKLLKM